MGAANREVRGAIEPKSNGESGFSSDDVRDGCSNTSGEEDGIPPLTAVSKGFKTMGRDRNMPATIPTLLEEPNVRSEANVLDEGEKEEAVGG